MNKLGLVLFFSTLSLGLAGCGKGSSSQAPVNKHITFQDVSGGDQPEQPPVVDDGTPDNNPPREDQPSASASETATTTPTPTPPPTPVLQKPSQTTATPNLAPNPVNLAGPNVAPFISPFKVPDQFPPKFNFDNSDPDKAPHLDAFSINEDDAPETKQDRDAEKLAPSQYTFESPIAGDLTITDYFGPRVLNTGKYSNGLVAGQLRPPYGVSRGGSFSPGNHTGVDISAPDRTPVHAIGKGFVYLPETWTECSGWVTVLKHELPSGPIFSLYEHLTPPSKGKSLQINQVVNQGDVIALSGHSGTPLIIRNGVKRGCVSGPHLHVELRIPLNPSDEDPKSAEDRKNAAFNREAPKVNPADYISIIDEECQKRKNVEINNARLLQKWYPKKLPPLIAGRCSQRYESRLTDVPRIYLSQE